MLDFYGESLTKMYLIDDGIFEVFYLEDIHASIDGFGGVSTPIEL